MAIFLRAAQLDPRASGTAGRAVRLASLLLVLLPCASCAGPRIAAPAQVQTPIVVGGSGALAPAAGEAVVASRLDPAHQDVEILALVDALRGQARAPLVAGNRVTLLVDGPQTLGAIRAAIERARHHVHVETYIFADDEIGREMREVLIRRRNEGVQVRVLYDGMGSLTTPSAFFERMQQAGIEVLQFRPVDPVRTPLPWKINNRDHRKIVIVDGVTAFTGGINISSTYASSSSVRPGPEVGLDNAWRDTHVQIDGPVAAQFQALFFETWTRAGGRLGEDELYFPRIGARGPELVAAVASEGGERGEAAIYATFAVLIQHSSRRLWMTQAYFAPNSEMRKTLIDAAQRGVDVRLIVPGFTDSALIYHASRASYDELLKGGVRIFEQNHALLHAKTIVVDTAISSIGSANFDMRSFLHNNEVTAYVVGSDFARQVERLFQRDAANAHELSLHTWRKRPALDKLKELASSLFSYWL